MSIKMAINGFGRIGRCAARIILERNDVELVAINDTATRDLTRYLLKYDSVHGEFKHDVRVLNDDYIEVDGKKIRVFSTRDANELAFSDFGTDVVLECTGANLTSEKCEKFIQNGVSKVVMSAPAKDDTPTFVYGVNSDSYKGEAIISNASCTTNCLAPVAKVLDDAFGIQKGLMTTIHAYTNGQSIVDAKSAKDIRRGRAGAVNIGPTTTGAAKAIGLVLPHLKGKLNGVSVRVPTPNVSMVDLVATLKQNVDKDMLNEAFLKASEGGLKGILLVDEDKRVSSDFIGSEHSSIVISDMLQVICEDTVKVLAWYDNEWGYSARLVDMGVLAAKFTKDNK
ncbi:glyceraldehyde 3-phosphate dehydrogenase A [Campylobacter pinnipediorum subsp. pinnipediorum]|uniref:type I glyceraldehyde-3-phosphate dehydrogenase n=1 Tax=Campylobacter pinnipediorum TaxID=1965231 RepID=UPI0009951D68|nr:type I glyceraldehyde-3-phosphate dehydrogenase [Campylobacter pinnipediorum]AQW80984.1 glyceraldehyde 3-phosphate dehydrogenase A [Campylobacter pinnipediorum subsp. pinnipediorum]